MTTPEHCLTDHTIVEWIAPNGERLRLSGAKDVDELGAWLDQDGIANAGFVDEKAMFDAAARQWGETYVGTTLDHAEFDVPLIVLGSDPGDFRRRVEHLQQLIRRDQVGWLATYTNDTGWRWVAARRGHLRSIEKIDPRKTSAAHFELMLIVELPIPQEAPDNDSWTNRTGTGRGQLALYPGPFRHAWPRFVLRGPGIFRIQYSGNDVPFPALVTGEEVLVNTDEARPIIRSSLRRNLHPLMKGRKFRKPIPADEVTAVQITVTGATASSEVYAEVPRYLEALL